MQGAMALECEDLPMKRRPRSAWMWPYLQRRVEYGHYDMLMEELYQEPPELYRNYTRMDRELFNEIVARVTPPHRKEDNLLAEADQSWTASGHNPHISCHRELIQEPQIFV